MMYYQNDLLDIGFQVNISIDETITFILFF